MTDDTSEKPDWWVENQLIREEMDLPDYTPPRFRNGVYTHEVVPELEERFDCEIQFAGLDPRYPEDWYVRVNGESHLRIGRRRDENGNTVYEIAAEEFRRRLINELE